MVAMDTVTQYAVQYGMKAVVALGIFPQASSLTAHILLKVELARSLSTRLCSGIAIC